jgi:hypothetical protein
MDYCDLRGAVNEVCEIMRFQLDQKKLAFVINISETVPSKVYTDVKRFK